MTKPNRQNIYLILFPDLESLSVLSDGAAPLICLTSSIGSILSKVLKLIKKQISCENNVWITAGLLIDQIPITTVEVENEISELKDQLFEIIHILGTISNMMFIITVFGQKHFNCFLKMAKMLSFLKYVERNSTGWIKSVIDTLPGYYDKNNVCTKKIMADLYSV